MRAAAASTLAVLLEAGDSGGSTIGSSEGATSRGGADGVANGDVAAAAGTLLRQPGSTEEAKAGAELLLVI